MKSPKLGSMAVLAALAWPAVASANTGFGFVGVYTEIAWVMLLPVILIEAAAYRWLLSTGWSRAMDISVRVNLYSTMLGFIASVALWGVYDLPGEFLFQAMLVFWMTSVAVEAVAASVMRFEQQRLPWRKVLQAALLGNCASYLAIVLAGDGPHQLTLALGALMH